MAEIPEELGFQKEEFTTQLPWIEPLLRRLNALATQVSSALKDLVIGTNVVGQIEEVRLDVGAVIADSFPLYFNVKMSRKPRVLLVGSAKLFTAPSTAWTTGCFPTWELVDGRVKINYLTSLTINNSYAFTFLLLP